MSEQKLEIENRFFKLLFAVRRSVRYHTHRRKHFERLAVATNFFVIATGSTVVGIASAGMAEHRALTIFFGALTATLGSLDLVVGFSVKACDYRNLARDFSQLEMQLVKAGANLDEKALAEMTNRRLEIEQNEPPVLRVLDGYCHNEMVRITDYKTYEEAEGEKITISFWQSVFMPWFDWWPSTIIKNKDREDWNKPKSTPGYPQPRTLRV